MNDSFLHNCLYFTANRLSRAMTKIAEEEFAPTGLTPMYGYIIRLVNGEPGITQKELTEKLYVAPSTMTRFIDKLQSKQLVERKVQGKTVLVYPTAKGIELEEAILLASKNLFVKYEAILGSEVAKRLSDDIQSASGQLEEK